MSVRIRQMINSVLVICLSVGMTAGLSFQALAASARISFSDPSVMVGNEVNVTMKATTENVSLDRVDIMLSYDSSKLEFISGTNAEGGAGSIKIKAGATEANTTLMKFTLKFKALDAGEAKISITTQEIYDGESQLITVSKEGSSTVKITPLAGFSNDASLSSLKISPGNLTPAFSADVTAYTATVGQDTERIAVSAGTTNANAKVVTGGNENLVMGDNGITIKVTAEDGSTTKDYSITVTKVEGTVEDSGEENAGEEASAKTIHSSERTYTILKLEGEATPPDGLVSGSVTIEENSLDGWVGPSKTEQQYFVFYGQDDQGQKGFYRYDLTDKTVQRYFQDPAVDTGVSRDQYVEVAELYNNLTKDYSNTVMIVWILAAVTVLSIISLVCVLVFKTKQGKKIAVDQHSGTLSPGDGKKEEPVETAFEEEDLSGQDLTVEDTWADIPGKSHDDNEESDRIDSGEEESDRSDSDEEKADRTDFDEDDFDRTDFDEDDFGRTDFDEDDFDKDEYDETDFDESGFEDGESIGDDLDGDDFEVFELEDIGGIQLEISAEKSISQDYPVSADKQAPAQKTPPAYKAPESRQTKKAVTKVKARGLEEEDDGFEFLDL